MEIIGKETKNRLSSVSVYTLLKKIGTLHYFSEGCRAVGWT